MLQTDYVVPTDARNRAKAGSTVTIDLTVRHQDDLTGLHPSGARVWTSYDDGLTWKPAAKVTDRGQGRYAVAVHHPAVQNNNGFVDLRIQAWDDAGNSVTQTVDRAYGLR